MASEPALEPELPVIDAHHHLWDKPGSRYYFPDYLRDLAECGHRVLGSVYVESRSVQPPPAETGFAAGLAARSAARGPGTPRVAAAIVGYADLCGDETGAALDAHLAAGRGRLRGIRHSAYWDADPAIVSHGSMTPPRQLLGSPAFRRGFAGLAARGLSFDAIVFHPQLPELADLARAFPGTSIVLNHMGTALGLGRFAGRRDEVFAQWQADLADLARCGNVSVKLGGAGRPQWGFGFDTAPGRPSSQQLAGSWRPYMMSCIELFGPDRCMFESNFPADRVSYDYGAYWNAVKTLTAGMSPAERGALFAGTARRVYRMELSPEAAS